MSERAETHGPIFPRMRQGFRIKGAGTWQIVLCFTEHVKKKIGEGCSVVPQPPRAHCMQGRCLVMYSHDLTQSSRQSSQTVRSHGAATALSSAPGPAGNAGRMGKTWNPGSAQQCQFFFLKSTVRDGAENGDMNLVPADELVWHSRGPAGQTL